MPKWLEISAAYASLAGVLFSIVAAWQAWRAQKKALEAKEAAERAAESAERGVLVRQAVDEFAALQREIADMKACITRSEWPRCHEIATRLIGLSGELSGWFVQIQKDVEKDKLEVVQSRIKSISDSLPLPAAAVANEELASKLLSQCDYIVQLTAEVHGSLKYQRS